MASKILIITGSSQANSQSLRIGQYIKSAGEKLDLNLDLVDLHEINLPIFLNQTANQWPQLAKQLSTAEGYIWIIPEWNGGANPSIKNMLLYTDVTLLGHKPVLLIGISAGKGGFYPIMDTKSVGQKDPRYVIIPDCLVINRCQEVLLTNNLDEQAEDYQLKLRINYILKILNLYIKNLNNLRQSKIIDYKTYPFGM
ncbi:MAG: NAD(P)H-dependent oxidoreductase [Candidatus Saccharibacteria bacterium]|nr:NAD(P)H-dependent oxidoreductase [Candidatus Saccharibacteria bacterium]